MADNVRITTAANSTPPDGTFVASDEAPYSGDTAKFQIIQISGVTGAEGSKVAEKVGADTANGLDVDVTRVQGVVSVNDNGGSLTVDGPLTDVQLRATAVPVSASSLPLPTGAATSALQTQPGVDIGDVTVNNAGGVSAVNIQDGGNTITVDGTVTSTPSGTQDVNHTQINGVAVSVGSGVLGTGTQRVVLSTDQPVVPVSDNGGSLTVDGPLTDVQLRSSPVPVSGTLSLSGSVDTELTTSDLDTGAGTDTRAVVGLVIAESGGGVLVGSANPLPVSASSLPLPTGAATSALQTQPGVDIGDVTINNASGVSAVNIQDGGNSITVDGTVTATPSGTQDVNQTQINGVAVSVGSGVLGTGTQRVVLATDQPVIPVSDNGSNLSVDNAGTFVVQENGAALTSLQLIDDTVFSDDAAFTPGTSKVLAIGAEADETTPDAVDEGDVGALRMTLNRGLHVNIRDDAGDSAMDGANNAVRVNVVAGGAGDGSILDGVSSSIKATVLDFTNSNPLAVRLTDTNGDYVGAGAGTQYIEDVASAADPTGTMVIAVRADSLGAVTTTDGDNIAARATNKGELYVKHIDAVPITDNGGSLTVDGTVDTELTTDDLDTGAGTDTRAVVGLVGSSSGGGQIIPGSSTDGLLVNLGTNNDVINSGTFVVQENGASLTSLQLIDDAIFTDDAAFTPATSKVMMAGAEFDDSTPDSVDEGDAGALRMSANRNLYIHIRDNAGNERGLNIDSNGDLAVSAVKNIGTKDHDVANAAGNNPVMNGLEAIAHGTNPTAVAAADVTKAYANRAGVPFIIGGHPNVVTLEAAYTAAQTDTAIITISSGLKIVVTSIMAVCDEANTVGVGLRVGFGGTNTPTTTGVVITHPGLIPGGGLTRGDGSGILGVGADGEDLRVTSEVPTGGSLRILVTYYTIES